MPRFKGAAVACALATGIALPLTVSASMAPNEGPTQTELHARHQLRRERAQSAVLRQQIKREREGLRRALHHQPSVDEAIHLSAVLFGADESRMRMIIRRESKFQPWAKNPSSTASGLAQFLDSTWATTPCGRAGMSVFSAYANALCMGWYIQQHGWGAWALTN